MIVMMKLSTPERWRKSSRRTGTLHVHAIMFGFGYLMSLYFIYDTCPYDFKLVSRSTLSSSRKYSQDAVCLGCLDAVCLGCLAMVVRCIVCGVLTSPSPPTTESVERHLQRLRLRDRCTTCSPPPSARINSTTHTSMRAARGQ